MFETSLEELGCLCRDNVLILFFLHLDRVRILRYEDLCFNTSKEAKDLLNFLDLSPSVFVDEYISTHTHKDGDKDGDSEI